MAGSVEDQLFELTQQINRLVKTFGGGGTSPYTNPTTGGTSSSNRGGKAGQAVLKGLSKLNNSAKSVTGAIDLMHGGVDDFVHMLSGAAKGFAVLEIAIGAFREVLKIGHTFTKMSDIGQNFNFNLATMMAQVGKAGLSMDEYSALLSRNSMATAAMGSDFDETSTAASKFAKNLTDGAAATTKSGRQSMASLQLSVRQNLQQFGMFGMSMDDVTGATSDYMETLRQSGNLYKYTDAQRRDSVVGLVSQATGLAAAFGRNREEIIKNTNEIMRQTTLSARLSIGTEAQSEATRKMISMLSAQSPLLASMVGEQYGKGGYVDTDMGNALINSGMGRVNDIVESGLIAPARRGEAPSSDAIVKIAQAFDPATVKRLINMHDPEADKALKLGLEAQASLEKYIVYDKNDKGERVARLTSTGAYVYDTAAIEKAKQDAIAAAKAMDAVTKNALSFESAFKQVTGGFLAGFYETFAKALGPDGPDGLNKTVDNLRKVFCDVGSALATAVVGLAHFSFWLDDLIKKYTPDIKKYIPESTGGKLAVIVTAVLGIMMARSFLKKFIDNFTGATLKLPGAIVRGGANIIRGGAKGAGSKRGFFGGIVDAIGGMMGGGGCCDEISQGLGALGEKIDFHGERAHVNATKGAGEIAEHAGAKVAGKGRLSRAATFLNRMTKGALHGLTSVVATMGSKAIGLLSALGSMTVGALHSLPSTGLNAGGVSASKATGAAGELLEDAGHTAKVGTEAAGKAGWLSRAATSLGHATAGALHGTGSFIAKMGSKVVGLVSRAAKFIPGVGLAMSGLFAYQRAQEGDYIGAAGEVLGGLASTIPIIGTAADAAIQAGLLARDLYGHDKTASLLGFSNTSSYGPGDGPPSPDQQKMGAITAQLDQLNKTRDDLQTAVQVDKQQGNADQSARDNTDLQKVLEDIRELTRQQLLLNKNTDQKNTQAIQEQLMYVTPMM